MMTSQKEENKRGVGNISTAYVKSRDTREESVVSFSDQAFMTYTSSHHRTKVNTSKLKKCLLQRRKSILAAVVAVLVLVLVIWLINRAQESRNFNSACSNTWDQALNASAECGKSTFGCGRLESVLPGCNSRTVLSWRIFTRERPEWETHSKILHGSLNKSQSILISPYFAVPPEMCTFNLSLCGVKYSNYTLTDDRGRVDTHHVAPMMDHTGCTESVYTNSNFLTGAKRIQLGVIVTARSTESIRYNLHFERCTKYRAIADYFGEKRASHTPDIPAVMGHNENRCSFEFGAAVGNGLMCDWWTVDSGDHPAQLEVVHSVDCIANGLISNPRGEKWFMVLTSSPSSSASSSASVISPAFRAHTSRVLLSYYYQLPCGGGRISVYITPPPSGGFSVRDYARVWSPFSQVGKETDAWTRVDVELPIPHSMMNDSFHILIHAELDGSGVCNNSDCHKPLIALEEIRTQLRFDQCKDVKGGHEILGCDFDDRVTCSWISSGEGIDFHDWGVESSGHSTDNTTGAQTRHLKGRGNILGFDPMGKANFEGVYLRSATVVANSNCSCNMQMSYLMRGEFVPRLTVYMKYGKSPDQHTKLWSVIGHQSEDWLEADIAINLIDQQPPFYIELRLSQILDSRGFINVDNFRFYDCDVSLVANATRSSEDYDPYDQYEW